MRRFATLFGSAVFTLAVCATAQAKPPTIPVHSTTPQGNGAVNQYIESIPTDHGNRPTNSLHGRGTRHGAGGGGVVGGGGGGTGGTGGTGAAGTGSAGTPAGSSAGGAGGAIAPATRRSLDKHGNDGQAAAALALSTAPVVARGQGGTSSQDQPSSSGGSSALGSLVSALTGSASNGGMGFLLPVILVVVLFGTAGMAIVRRRRQT